MIRGTAAVIPDVTATTRIAHILRTHPLVSFFVLSYAITWTLWAPTVAADPAGGVPPVSPQAAAARLVDVRTVVPDAIVDLRYATPDNFTGVQLYPSDARCLVHESMAPGLATAAAALRAQGAVLVFWDCYRPHDVQVRMFDVVPNPAWVAEPGPYARSHEAGRSVDVTIAEQQAAWWTWAPDSMTSPRGAGADASTGSAPRRSRTVPYCDRR